MLATIESVAKITGIAVASFGVFKYFDSIQQAKIDRTVSHVDAFYAGAVFGAREHLGSLSHTWLQTGSPDGTQLSYGAYTDLVAADLAKPSNRLRVEIVLDYFERTRSCVENGACDVDVAAKLLRPLAKDIGAIVRPLVILERQKHPDAEFAQGLLCFADWVDRSECFGGRRIAVDAELWANIRNSLNLPSEGS